MTTAILVLARTLHLGSAVVLVGLLFFRLVVVPPEVEPEEPVFVLRLERWLIAAWIIQVLSGAVWFWVVAAGMNDVSLKEALDVELWSMVMEQTRFGLIWLARLVVIIVLGGVFFGIWRRRRAKQTNGLWLAFSLSATLLFSLAWVGHAGAGINHHGWHLAADVAHLGLGAIWPGGLLPLALLLNATSKSNQTRDLKFMVRAIHRFSRISCLAVFFLFLSGFVNACFLVPSLSALFTSGYGQLLLGKIGLFLAMVSLGAWNRFRTLPGLQLDAGRPGFLKLRRTVLLENLLALLVLLIVGLMGATKPPEDAP